jgi:hypothetical protein
VGATLDLPPISNASLSSRDHRAFAGALSRVWHIMIRGITGKASITRSTGQRNLSGKASRRRKNEEARNTGSMRSS